MKMRGSMGLCLRMLAVGAALWFAADAGWAQGASPGVSPSSAPGVLPAGKPGVPPGAKAAPDQAGAGNGKQTGQAGQGEQVNNSLPMTTLQIQTKLVSLDVVVVDDKGKPVGGLKKEDFTIYEDNKAFPTRNFDGWESRAEKEKTPDKPTIDKYGRPSWGQSPLAILVLDNISTQFSDAAYAAGMLKRYLKNEPELMPVPTMLMMVSDQGYKTLQPFTRDRASLMTALDKRPPVLPSRLARGDSGVIMVQTFLVLQQIALAEAGLTQHKSIIWVGPGFPSIDPTELDDKDNGSLTKAIRSTVDLLLDTHTTVYKIDPVATTTSTAGDVDEQASLDIGSADADLATPPEDPLKDNFNFNEFAVQTGGHYYFGLNNLDHYFEQAVDNTDKFYTLTFNPRTDFGESTDTYHKIRVTVNKPGLFVTTREGFYSGVPPEPPPTTKELGMSLSSVANGDMTFSGVGIHVLKAEPGKNPGSLSLTFEVENRSLAWTIGPNGTYTADATAVLVGMDTKKVVDGSAAFRLRPYLSAANAPQRFDGSLTVRDELPLNAKMATVKLIVRDSSGRIGTAEVPRDQFAGMIPQGSGKRR